MEMKLGPLGFYSYGKTKWEETCRDPISHIFVTYDSYVVNSIQFGYVENGALVLSKKHGSEGPEDSTRIVWLNHESEYITGISGDKHLSFLTFHTNERKHVAFKKEFNPPKLRPDQTIEIHSGIRDRCEFGGFVGSFDSDGLSSIGLCIRPVPSGVPTIKQENV
ncbi:BnaC04g49250D [Brassica napus]|uniref:BnaC04g49250D protein n=1 Tax=Brassica napus TaxID=3708 RepID=A0A078GE80_BRANA|nr:BnaC04g49250D [Brassica napus]